VHWKPRMTPPEATSFLHVFVIWSLFLIQG
jgi:hypothetical protein